MAEYVRQDNPQVSPKHCYFCGNFEGPFINTFTSDSAGRIILICAPNDQREAGCAGQIAVAAGGCGPEGIAVYEEQLATGDEIIAGLREELETLRPLRDVRDKLAAA